jgi:hypothetical protein
MLLYYLLQLPLVSLTIFRKLFFGMVDFEFLKLTCSSSNAPLSLSRRIMLTCTISMLLYHLLQLPLVSLIIFRKLFFGLVEFRIFKAHLLKFQHSAFFVSSNYIDKHYFKAFAPFA